MSDVVSHLDKLESAFDSFQKKYQQRLEKLEETNQVSFEQVELETKNLEHDTIPEQKTDRLAEVKDYRPTLDTKTIDRGGELMETKQAFTSYLTKGDSTELNTLETKSLSAGSEANGGYFIPEEIGGHIRKRLSDYSVMRRISNILYISTQSLDLLVDKKDPGAGWVAETGNRDETDTPELAKIKIPVHEIYARPRATQKLLEDAQINVEDWLVSRVVTRMAQMENNAFIHGDGNGKPKGFLAYETVEKSAFQWGKLEHIKTGSTAGFTGDSADILIDLTGSLKTEYLPGATWLMSRSAYMAVQKLKDKNGNYIWQPSLQENSRSTLLGYPVEISEDMPELSEKNPAKAIAFGNFKAGYQIVDRRATEVLRDPYTSKPYVEFYTTRRVGGDVIDFDAIKILNFSK